MEKNKVLIYAIVAIVVIAIFFLIYASVAKASTTSTGGTTTTTSGGIGNLISNWFGRIFGGNKPTKCDPNKPGYDINGFPSIDCGFGG